MKLMMYMFGFFLLVYLSGCSESTSALNTVDGKPVLPRTLAQTRTLDRDSYRITVLLDNQNQPFELSRNNGQFALELTNLIDNGSYLLTVKVDLQIGNELRPLYVFQGDLAVDGNQVKSISPSELFWPDDDGDGIINFIELDQSSFDIDADGNTNDRDTDADGDGALDNADPTPFASSNEPQMIEIKSGCFKMGANDSESNEDERPIHDVCVSTFNIGVYEITYSQYDTYVDAQLIERVDDRGLGRGDRPITDVSWDDIQKYISWLNLSTGKSYRLPTEAEWEFVARAGSTTKYSWGDEVGVGNANCSSCESSFDEAARVGSFESNAWGVYDMHGNVWEWVEDKWHVNYYGAPSDGRAWIDGSKEQRVQRGGSWNFDAKSARSASRNWVLSDNGFSYTGFRLARDN